MGKKSKKTKWRTLEISLPIAGKNYHESSANVQWDDRWRLPSHKYRHSVGGSYEKVTRTSSSCDVGVENFSCKESRAETLIEEEYTKITTPRQDVLFKKGYLTKRKTSSYIGDGNIPAAAANDTATTTDDMINVCFTQQNCVSNDEEEFCDYANAETNGGGDLLSQSQMQPQARLLCTASPPYLDASSAAAAAALYYGGGYEIYDPYTGNVTALVVGTASPSVNGATATANCQPILASMPCSPLPLQPLQWFSPVPSSSEWFCGAYTTATHQTNVNSSSSASCAVMVATTSAIDTEDNAEQSPYNVPDAESSCSIENTTNAATAGDGDLDLDSPLYPCLPQSNSQSYAYSSYVFATSVCDFGNDGGKIRYDSLEFPILCANQSVATKRKKKRKRRRRFEDTEDDSESGVEGNLNECVFAYACDDDDNDNNDKNDKNDNNDYNDDVSGAMVMHRQRSTLNGWLTSYQHRCKCTVTLPRASVNAPPFVPCDRMFARERQTPLPHAYPESVSCSFRNSERGENSFDAANVGSSAQRTSLANSCSKSLTDSPSSSSNSDSGISSPANEDCSSRVVERQDFQNPVEADRSKNVDDMPHNYNDNDNSNNNDDDKSWSMIATATVNASTGGVDAPINSSSSSSSSSSVELANGDKHDKDQLLKKSQMKNCLNTRAVAVTKRYYSKNEDCDSRLEAVGVSDVDNANDHRNPDDTLDVDDNDVRNNVGTAVVEGYSTLVIAGNGQMIHRRAEQSQQSLWKRNISSDYDEYKGEIDWSDTRQNDDSDPSKTSSGSENCNGDLIDSKSQICDEASHVDHNDSFRRDGLDAEVQSRWPTAISTMGSPPRQLDENFSVDSNADANVEENASVDMYTLTKIRSARYDTASSSSLSPLPLSVSTAIATSMSRFPSQCRDKLDGSRKFIGSEARAIVEEIVQQAELRIRTSAALTATKKCDKLRLPLTQAVTNWLNERGGLPPALRDSEHDCRRNLARQRVDDSSDASKTHLFRERVLCSNSRNSPENLKTRSNCVIC